MEKTEKTMIIDRIQQILDSLKKGEDPPTLDTSNINSYRHTINGLRFINQKEE